MSTFATLASLAAALVWTASKAKITEGERQPAESLNSEGVTFKTPCEERHLQLFMRH
jgi:hypothetical protein